MGGKKKKKGEIASTTGKKLKRSANVDERAKQAMALQPPDENPYKMENERNIDGFFRFANRGKPNDRLTIRDRLKGKKR